MQFFFYALLIYSSRCHFLNSFSKAMISIICFSNGLKKLRFAPNIFSGHKKATISPKYFFEP